MLPLRRTITVLLTLVLSQTVGATNGYFTHGLGIKNKSLAGAGTATPQEAIANANNPAAAVMMPTSMGVGLSLFSPQRGFNVSPSLANGNGGALSIDSSIDSSGDLFPVPYLAWNWRRSEDNAIGISVYGRGGMNTQYTSGSATFDPDGLGPAPVATQPGVFGAGELGVDFAQLFIDMTYARKTGSLAWGITAVIAAQSMEVTGVGTFAPYTQTFAASGGTQQPTNLSDNGHDLALGLGYKLGVLWRASATVRIGASYQSKINMAEFDDYSDLFNGAGGFDVPESIKAGVSWDTSDQVTIHIDVEQTLFSDIGSVGTSSTALFDCPTAGAGGTRLDACLGGATGAGFGWDDMTTYKFGLTFRPKALADWTFRGGISHGSQPVNSADLLFNIMAPGVIENHITFGASTYWGEREVSIGLMYAPEETLTGTSAFDPTQTIQLNMSQYELEFSIAF